MPDIIKPSIECWVLAKQPSLDALVLLLQAEAKEAHPAFWQPITGGMEPGETPEQACRREVCEETSLVLAASALVPLGQTFDVPMDQKLTIYKTVFLAVTPYQPVQLSEEHIGWQLVPFREAKERLYWPSNHETYAGLNQLLRG